MNWLAHEQWLATLTEDQLREEALLKLGWHSWLVKMGHDVPKSHLLVACLQAEYRRRGLDMDPVAEEARHLHRKENQAKNGITAP